MNYCSNCGSNILEFKIPEGDHLQRFVCSSCGTIHYSNPNMIVGCLIEDEDKIMLCRRGIEPRKGYWNLPCGFLENNEAVQDGAVREVFEETGAKVQLGALHVVYNLPKANQVYLIFRAKMLGSKYHITPESTEICFFEPNAIPWNEIAFSSNSFAIKHLIQLKQENQGHRLAIGTYSK